MKTLIYILGLAVLGYVAYDFLMKKDEGESIITNPPVNTYLQTQPEQMFPLSISKDPRVDNADQPWYGGDRSFMGVTSDAAGLISSGTSLNYQTNESWTALASMYTH